MVVSESEKKSTYFPLGKVYKHCIIYSVFLRLIAE